MRRPQIFGKTLFVDLMMGTLVVVTFLLQLSNAIEKKKKQDEQNQARLVTDGKYAVIMEWPDASEDDLDLYVRDPEGNIAFFNSRDVGLMHLEHDDQGATSDKVLTSKGVISVDRNEERVILRGVMAGEYLVNVHMYNKRDPGPTEVTVSLILLKEDDATVAKKKLTLAAKGDERTAFRFSLAKDGTLLGTNELPRLLVNQGPRGGF